MNDRKEGGPEGTARKWKAVYTIVDGRGEKKYWLRIGIGFENRDGSYNIRLDAVPTNGTLHMRDADPAEQRSGSDSLDGNGAGSRRGGRDGQPAALREVQ